MKPIQEYTDFRRFLADALDARRKARLPCSHRYLHAKLGVKSSGFLSNVLSGSRNISDELAIKLAGILDLDDSSKSCLLALIHFNQASTPEERTIYFRNIREAHSAHAERLTPERHSLFRRWFHVALFELAQCPGAGTKAENYARRLVPSPGIAAVKQALAELEADGFLVRRGERFHAEQPNLTTGDDIESRTVASFQRETIDLGRESLDRFDIDARDVSCLTLAVSNHSWVEVREALRNFRRQLLAISSQDPCPDRVVQCNFQFFPIANPDRHEE